MGGVISCTLTSNAACAANNNIATSNLLFLTPVASPSLGPDTLLMVNCDACTVNLTGLYNTTGLTASWSAPNPAAALPGYYQLKATNNNNCSDYAFVSVYANNGNTISLCPNGDAALVSDRSGTFYQWQVNNGSGFVNVNASEFYYLGSNSKTLRLRYTPSSYYGNQYRCVVDGNNSSVYTLKFVSTWNGSVNGNWTDPLNWNCGAMPDENTDVVINSGTVVLNTNTTIRSIKLNPLVNFTVGAGYKLTILH